MNNSLRLFTEACPGIVPGIYYVRLCMNEQFNEGRAAMYSCMGNACATPRAFHWDCGVNTQAKDNSSVHHLAHRVSLSPSYTLLTVSVVSPYTVTALESPAREVSLSLGSSSWAGRIRTQFLLGEQKEQPLHDELWGSLGSSQVFVVKEEDTEVEIF